MENNLPEMLEEAAAVMGERLAGRKPVAGVILGTGLGDVVCHVKDAVVIPYNLVPHMQCSTANTHVGQSRCGTFV